MAFKIYILFTISYFLHIPERVEFLGSIRFDLLLMCLTVCAVLASGKKVINIRGEKKGWYETTNILTTLIIYIIASIPFVKWPGSVVHTNSFTFIKAIIFYYFTVFTIDSEKKLKIFILTFITCQSIRVLEPLYLHYTTGYWGSFTSVANWEYMNRLAGSPHDIVNPNGLAFIITSIVPFYHYLCMYSSLKWKMLYFILLPLFIHALILTASRTGFLALVVVMAGMLWKSKKKFLFIAVTSIVSIIITFNYLDQEYKERYLSIYSKDTRHQATSEGRLKGVIEDFKVGIERPIFGHGLGTSLEANANIARNPQISHNLYAEIFQELGIIGLMIYLWFILSICKNYSFAINMFKESNMNCSGYLINASNAMQVWLWMNILFSFASYGLSSYEWYLFGGLSTVLLRISNVSTRIHINEQDYIVQKT